MSLVVTINGKPQRARQARISVLDHGFLFGDSVYEVLRSFNGRLFAFEDHWQRLQRSARRIGLAVPWDHEGLEREIERTRRFLRRQAAPDAPPEDYLRLVITRGVGPLNIDPSDCHAPTTLIFARPWQELPAAWYRRGVRVIVASVRRNAQSALDPDIKSGNYLNNVMAIAEAKRAGAVEALMLNAKGDVAEATTSNVFIVERGVLLTPPPAAGILRGITRDRLLAAAREAGIRVREARISRPRLLGADEVFLSSTLKLVLPVVRIDDTRIGCGRPGALTKRCGVLLNAVIAHECGA